MFLCRGLDLFAGFGGRTRVEWIMSSTRDLAWLGAGPRGRRRYPLGVSGCIISLGRVSGEKNDLLTEWLLTLAV